LRRARRFRANAGAGQMTICAWKGGGRQDWELDLVAVEDGNLGTELRVGIWNS